MPQWLAGGAETDPLRRARLLQRSWERLLGDGALGLELPPGATAGLRPTIVESWRRSLATGLDPTDLLAPIEADESEVLERWFEHPLGSLSHVLTELLGKVAQESRSMVVVTDASGLVLHRLGDEWLKERAAEMNLVEGARYSEGADGTNGIGTALAADQPYQVFAFEHFNERHHQWICSGAPVHDPVSGQTIGLIDLSSLWKTAPSRSLELVTAAARAIEQCLVDARCDRDARLRRRYTHFMTRSSDLLVDRDGYVLDGATQRHPIPFGIPEGGGEVVLADGSVAVAAPLGRGEAFLLRQGTTRHAESVPAAGGLERAEERAWELATEQAALRQVATLVAGESSPDQLFAVVAKQVAGVFDVPHVRLLRYEPEGSVVVGGFAEHDDGPFPIGSRWPLDSPGVIATVRQTGRPARVEDYAHLTGEIAAVVRGAGMRSAVASPIVVARRLWGAMVVLCERDDPLPADTEARLSDFTELVAAAIANAESRAALARLADEQAALRRVAILIAQQPSPSEVFTAVTREVGLLLDADLAVLHVFPGDGTTMIASWSGDGPGLPSGTRFPLDGDSVAARIFETAAPARLDNYPEAEGDAADLARDLGVRSTVGAPVIVEGKLWGALMAATRGVEPWAENAESRIAAFTELVATAIANAESREALAELADEQAAMRRVATLVAQGASPRDLVAAVTEEVGSLLPVSSATMGRFEPDGSVTTIASWSSTEVAFPTGQRWPTEGTNVAWMVLQTGRSARLDDFSAATDPIGVAAREAGMKSAVGSPIVVEGHLWGVMTATSTEGPLPPDTEARLASFTELVATAIANAKSQGALERLADEQAALRRVATLVAQGASPQDLFAAVAEEVGRLLLAANVSMGRYEPDDTVTSMASWSSAGPVFTPGVRWPIKGTNVAWMVLQTGKSARIDDFSAATDPIGIAVREAGYKSAIGSPIVVEGHLWGAISAASTEGPMQPGSEARLASFTELVGTAIANAESQSALERLADEQAALGRIATLVAQGVPPARIFSAVSDEVGRLFGSDQAGVTRFDPEGPAIVLVGVAQNIEDVVALGTRWELHDSIASARVFRTGRSARVDRLDGPSPAGPAAETITRLDLQSTVASPIVVEGRLWGTVTLSSSEEPFPADTEQRLEKFTELVATAIANAEGKSELAASRRRIVAAGDEARRRIERDLHDGIQQRLIALALRARAMAGKPTDELPGTAAELAQGLRETSDELREISRGIHPAILTEAGLRPALRALARRSSLPVDADVELDDRFPAPVEAAAYYIASEALTNVAKHAQAKLVELTAANDNGVLTLEVRDDGIGGADARRGSGILGLTDRAEALGGTITIASPPGGGTTLTARLPIAT